MRESDIMGPMKTYLDTLSRADRELSEEDLTLAHALQINGRASFREIADALGVSDQTAARRWSRLQSAGKLRVLGLTDPQRVGDSPWIVPVRCTPGPPPSHGGVRPPPAGPPRPRRARAHWPWRAASAARGGWGPRSWYRCLSDTTTWSRS
ncbi:Lrp/AsnC family transcriptional regulator [Streptomyces sp. NPDC059095]|uniref:Lrp/AsnC family transcriptional regulator n=1 Tax=Streptomyces sp. NPDC059095 TaxID=3346726 RepID=UPI0036A2B811